MSAAADGVDERRPSLGDHSAVVTLLREELDVLQREARTESCLGVRACRWRQRIAAPKSGSVTEMDGKGRRRTGE